MLTLEVGQAFLWLPHIVFDTSEQTFSVNIYPKQAFSWDKNQCFDDPSVYIQVKNISKL